MKLVLQGCWVIALVTAQLLGADNASDVVEEESSTLNVTEVNSIISHFNTFFQKQINNEEFVPEDEGLGASSVLIFKGPSEEVLLQKPPSAYNDAYSWWHLGPRIGWIPVAPPPEGITLTTDWQSAPAGNAFIVFITPEPVEGRALLFNTIIGQWSFIAAPQVNPNSQLVSIPGGQVGFTNGDGFSEWNFPAMETNYGWIDITIVVGYLAFTLGIGVYFSRRSRRSNADYFRGGGKIPGWASGLSLLATGASGISLMAMPGMAFAQDWRYFSMSLFVLVTTLIVLFVYVPLVRRINVSTSNEYLEKRFGSAARIIGTVSFSLNQILARTAAIMLLPAIALNLIMGIPVMQSILAMGLVTTVYATMGGFGGVVWTDVFQSALMLFSVLLCIVWAGIYLELEWSSAFSMLGEKQKLQMFDPRISLLEPTIFVLFANAFFATLSCIGDQNFIQRMQCTESEREAKKAVVTQVAIGVPMNFLLFALGTIIFLFYAGRPELLNPNLSADGIFPLFAAQNLPTGLSGVVVAAVFAATMSTLSSALNSTANVGVEDIYRKYFRVNLLENEAVLVGKLFTIVLGITATALALWLVQADLKSVWDIALAITGMILGPVSGFFLLGVFTKRANQRGILMGGLVSIVLVALLRSHSPISHLMFLPIAVITCFVSGYLCSLIFHNSNNRQAMELTVFSE